MEDNTSNQIIPIAVVSIFIVVLSIGIFVFLNKESNSLPNGSENTTLDSFQSGNENLNLDNVQGESMSKIEDFDSLEITTLQEGQGVEAKIGDTVSVNYEGKLTDGTKFDSSYDRGIPFEFTLGQNRVIQGWEEGVKGMEIGEVRELKIPSSMGYGASGSGPIPGSAGLIFKVELLGIK